MQREKNGTETVMHQDNPSMVLNRYHTMQRKKTAETVIHQDNPSMVFKQISYNPKEKNGTENVMHQDNPSMVLNRYHTIQRKKTALRPLCIKIIPQWC